MYLFNEILKNKNIKKQYDKTDTKIKQLIKTFIKNEINNLLETHIKLIKKVSIQFLMI